MSCFKNLEKNKKIILMIISIITILVMFVVLSIYICSSFSVDNYSERVQIYEKYVNETVYVSEINNKLDAIISAEEAWENFFNIGSCTYSVSYDKKADSWLIIGRSTNYFNPIYHIYGITGGIKGAIIQSDGKVIALWHEM